MSVGDWIGVISLALVIPLGVMTNLLTPRVVAYLENRKLVNTHKTREQALAVFTRVRAFKEGKRDKYAYYIILGASSTLSGLASASIMIIVMVLQPLLENVLVAYMVVSALAALSAGLLAEIYETARRLERFADYKAEIEQRWGPIEDA
jgi:hypothetical protein